MIILIGGSSHVGKTLIAQKLLEKTAFPYISLDHLKMGFIRSGMTKLSVEDDYEMRYFLWPFAAEIAKTAIENQQNLIMEGCYIPGEWKQSFTEDYLAHIYGTFITMSEGYIRKHFSLIASCASAIERRIDDKPDMERLIQCSKDFQADCERFAIPNLHIGDTDSFNADALAARILQEAGIAAKAP